MNTKEKKTKIKTFQVSEETHLLVMQYCKANSLKANDFVSKLLSKTIRSLNGKKQTTA